MTTKKKRVAIPPRPTVPELPRRVLAQQLLEQQLGRIEADAWRRLQVAGYPNTSISELQVVGHFGEVPPRNRDQRKAYDAFHRALMALVYSQKVRDYCQDDQPELAAEAALQLAIYSGDILKHASTGAKQAPGQSKGGTTHKKFSDARHAHWQTIADSLTNRKLSTFAAAKEVQKRLLREQADNENTDNENTDDVPAISTLRKVITYRKTR